jgi:hypothetical protein
MIDFGKFYFIQEYKSDSKLTHEMRGDTSLNELIKAFEMFLKGAGFSIPDGAHLDIVYDVEDIDEEDIDEEDT